MLYFSWGRLIFIYLIGHPCESGIYSPKGFLQKAQLAQKSDCGHFRNDRGHDAETVQNLNAMSNKCLLEEGCRGILYDGAHYYLCSTVPLVSEEEGTFDMYIKDACQKSSECISRRPFAGFCHRRYGVSGYCQYCNDIHSENDKYNCKNDVECRKKCLKLNTTESNSGNDALNTTGVAIGVTFGCLIIIVILSGVLLYRKHKNKPMRTLDSPQLSIHKIYSSDGFGRSVSDDPNHLPSNEPDVDRFL